MFPLISCPVTFFTTLEFEALSITNGWISLKTQAARLHNQHSCAIFLDTSVLTDVTLRLSTNHQQQNRFAQIQAIIFLCRVTMPTLTATLLLAVLWFSLLFKL